MDFRFAGVFALTGNSMASIAPGTSLRPERAVATGVAGSANVPRQGLRPRLLLYSAAPATPITKALLAYIHGCAKTRATGERGAFCTAASRRRPGAAGPGDSRGAERPALTSPERSAPLREHRGTGFAGPQVLPPGGLRAAAPSLPAQTWTARSDTGFDGGAACKARRRRRGGVPVQSACLRRKAGISKSSMPPEASASTLAAAWVRLVRQTLGTPIPA